MLFTDRKEAGILLAEALEKYRGEDIVVFALPRGGVPLGVEIAKKLAAPLDLLITKKIGHPFNPEYAIGAITEDADPIFNPGEHGVLDQNWLEWELKRLRQEIKRRRETYVGAANIQSLEGKTAIIVDDGIATGFTMFASIAALKKRNPKRIIVAVPVTPEDTAKKMDQMVDAVVALERTDDYLGAVGAYYVHFDQLDDAEVVSLLRSMNVKEEEADE